MTISKELQQFYKDNNFANDGGFNEKYFDLKFKLFSIKIPNSQFRKDVIHIHDIQHILYNCDTSWKGEAFIAGYEISSGMWKHLPIGFMSLWAMGFSLLNYPKDVLKGYKAGSKSKNLLEITLSKEELLSLTKKEVFDLLSKKDSFCWIDFIFWGILSLFSFLFLFLVPLLLLL
ncbi:hypothetical protein WH52_11530 [Tenacibaculum holothuriorum]|uniref:Coenzyme Q (Ubiquinone) biosynthesis protein Coq4 n=1 Tax=Tenacibaculum holothuriorum TaxID=1635173 RepID=A0A1Y2PCL6_9FLAO|nr:hypothetical protein [Tenacibaculum holothuriorum]OSY87489.1 hypothetical protein WH52_11530 [Tenacibaculum holothuriorum]